MAILIVNQGCCVWFKIGLSQACINFRFDLYSWLLLYYFFEHEILLLFAELFLLFLQFPIELLHVFNHSLILLFFIYFLWLLVSLRVLYIVWVLVLSCINIDYFWFIIHRHLTWFQFLTLFLLIGWSGWVFLPLSKFLSIVLSYQLVLLSFRQLLAWNRLMFFLLIDQLFIAGQQVMTAFVQVVLCIFLELLFVLLVFFLQIFEIWVDGPVIFEHATKSNKSRVVYQTGCLITQFTIIKQSIITRQIKSMSEIGNRLKQTMQDQELNLKFMELLNSNRNIQSIKDREILPAIPLSAFNHLPQIHAHKHKLNPSLPKKSASQTKIRLVDQPKTRKQTQYLVPVDTMHTGSAKNLIKIRNKSVQSSHRSRSIKQQIKNKQSSHKRQLTREPQSNRAVPLVQKSIIQMQITPQKLKLDMPSNAHTSVTKNTKLLSNKTIQQISSEAVDNLMLNVKFGKIQQNISYKSYLKKDLQPTPADIIKKLEDWLNKFKIKSALIYTKNLHQIFSRKSIPNEMILAEFANSSTLKKQLEGIMPGLQYYPEGNKEKGRNLAATKIQSLFRMNFQIKYTKKLKSLMNKVKIIQRQWKVSLAYKRGREKIMNRVALKIERVKTLTNEMIKNWQFIRTSPRVQVHICSIALQQFKRLSIPDLQQRQIAQITRIFKSIQPDCTVIYVTPFRFSGETLRYYQRIFQFGKKGDSFRDRLYFVSVESALTRISSYLTTVSALIYDHGALQKIKQIIRDRQTPVMGQTCAFIVPSYPSNQFTNLAAQLDIPVFSGAQSQCKLYSTKSGYYELFKPIVEALGEKCPFSIPKTVHGIYSQKQLLTVLAVLIRKNKQIKKWLFKIDDEVNSRGLAVLNVDGLSFLKQLRKQESGENQQQNIEEKDMIGLIVDELKEKLKVRLKIIHKSVYPDYNSYISHFFTRGGFLQACIEPETKECTTSRPVEHSISFKIQPNGQFQILTTYSRLQLGYKTISSTIQCPSQLSPREFDNEKIVRALYRHLWTKHKLIGYFTADFLYLQDPKETKQTKQTNLEAKGKRYLIGFDCFLNEKTSSIFVPSLTSICEYSKQTNKFNVKQNLPDVKDLSENLNLSLQSQRTPTETSYDLSTKRQNKSQKELYFIYCPFLKLFNLPQIADFFKMCKFSNISFDIQTKTGSLFLLQGGLENGCLGFTCINQSKEKVQEQALKLIQFISKQFREVGKKNAKQGYKSKQISDQIGQLRGFLLNSLRKNKLASTSMKRQDINLQMIF